MIKVCWNEVFEEHSSQKLIRLFDLYIECIAIVGWVSNPPNRMTVVIESNTKERRTLDEWKRNQRLQPVLCLVAIESWSHAFPTRTGSWNDSSPMIVWIAHVKVGHHQTPYSKTPVQKDRGFILWRKKSQQKAFQAAWNLLSTIPVIQYSWKISFFQVVRCDKEIAHACIAP